MRKSKPKESERNAGPIATLAHNLRYFRRDLGLSQTEIANATGVSFRLIQEIERGRGNPTIETIAAIAKCFKVTTTRLLNLNFVRLATNDESFVKQFKLEFEKSKISVALRDLSGNVIWSNLKCQKLHGQNFDGKKVDPDIWKRLTHESYEILAAEMQAELRGFASPYTMSIFKTQAATPIYVRCHPTLVYPKFGYTPQFASVYVSPMEEDCEVNYYLYVKHLFNCMEKLEANA